MAVTRSQRKNQQQSNAAESSSSTAAERSASQAAAAAAATAVEQSDDDSDFQRTPRYLLRRRGSNLTAPKSKRARRNNGSAVDSVESSPAAAPTRGKTSSNSSSSSSSVIGIEDTPATSLSPSIENLASVKPVDVEMVDPVIGEGNQEEQKAAVISAGPDAERQDAPHISSVSNAEDQDKPNPSSVSDDEGQEETNSSSASDSGRQEASHITLSSDTEDIDETSDGISDSGSEDELSLAGSAARRRATLSAMLRAAVRRERKSWFQRVSERLMRHHPELQHVWDDLDNAKRKEVVPIEQPKDLKLPLLPFQKYGVGWMRQQEQTDEFKGGILADEMGMGKTIQAIALLLTQRRKPNLVAAPTVALMQWKNEIETHTNKALSVYIYHGPNRMENVQELAKYDVVLTTYSIIEGCFRRQEVGKKVGSVFIKEKSPLHQINWHRIILDEAHNIKDRARNTAKAVFDLKANYRWSLTGTPLQNRVGELYSLLRFMQADPFGYYYCKKCPCKSLNWEFSDKISCDNIDCRHSPMDHVCWWNNEVLKPIQSSGYVGEGRRAMEKLRKLLDKIMLRRTKVQCADDLGLPPRNIFIRRDFFNEEEEDLYQSLYSDSARQFSSYVEQGSVLNNYANIFELLMRMRQCANHPDLVTKKKEITSDKQLVCMLCNETPEDAIAAACRHVFCRECCVQYLQSFDDTENQNESLRCPSCFAIFSVDLSQPPLEVESCGGTYSRFSKTSIVNRIDMKNWRSSTKIEALVEELSKLRTEDRTIKSIVFSQFVNFLDLVYWRLSREGFECIRLDGTMSPQQRDAAIKHFMTKPSVTVFLISLKAGGVALNLTEASHVFMCDPWWNPAAELQAMDRIHRLGQHRPIKVTRLIIENSIESRIIQLQEKKTALVQSTVERDTSALERLSVEDLRFLFVM